LLREEGGGGVQRRRLRLSILSQLLLESCISVETRTFFSIHSL
jgi:hypothetical protein